jgi:hypothetical protein
MSLAETGREKEAPPGFEPGMADLQSMSHSPQGNASQEVVKSLSFSLAHSLARETQIDPDLVRMIDAWPVLPAALKAGILAMIDAARQ